MTDLYPFEGRFFDLDGIRMHYLDEGSGPPVVLLHGNPTWSFFYRDLLRALSPHCRVIVPDHVGCGRSDKPSARDYDYTLGRRVSDLEALLDHLGLDAGVTLGVHDWGGMIGMAAAVRRPQRIARLIIFNTAAFPLPAAKRLPWEIAVCRNPLLGSWLVRGLNAFARGAARKCVVRGPLPPAVRAGFLAPYDSWAHRIAVHRFVTDIPLRPTDRAWPLLEQTAAGLETLRGRPTLICWGERDFVFDTTFLAEWIRHFPEAEVHRFADAGHYLLEDAGDEIIPRVAAFVSATGDA